MPANIVLAVPVGAGEEGGYRVNGRIE